MSILEVTFMDGKVLNLEVETVGDQSGFFSWGGPDIIPQANRYGFVFARDGVAVAVNCHPSGEYNRIDQYPLASIRKLKIKPGTVVSHESERSR